MFKADWGGKNWIAQDSQRWVLVEEVKFCWLGQEEKREGRDKCEVTKNQWEGNWNSPLTSRAKDKNKSQRVNIYHHKPFRTHSTNKKVFYDLFSFHNVEKLCLIFRFPMILSGSGYLCRRCRQWAGRALTGGLPGCLLLTLPILLLLERFRDCCSLG